jgi:hypothetical protein
MKNLFNKQPTLLYLQVLLLLVINMVCSLLHFQFKSILSFYLVNLDDCWQVSRDADGTIQADPHDFPSGIPALADYVHSKNLKFGLYSGIR